MTQHLSDYFDPYNKEHLEMFNNHHLHGVFTHEFKQFMADNSISQDYLWDVVAVQKMAKAWIGRELRQPMLARSSNYTCGRDAEYPNHSPRI